MPPTDLSNAQWKQDASTDGYRCELHFIVRPDGGYEIQDNTGSTLGSFTSEAEVATAMQSFLQKGKQQAQQSR